MRVWLRHNWLALLLGLAAGALAYLIGHSAYALTVFPIGFGYGIFCEVLMRRSNAYESFLGSKYGKIDRVAWILVAMFVLTITFDGVYAMASEGSMLAFFGPMFVSIIAIRFLFPVKQVAK